MLIARFSTAAEILLGRVDELVAPSDFCVPPHASSMVLVPCSRRVELIDLRGPASLPAAVKSEWFRELKVARSRLHPCAEIPRPILAQR